MARNITGNKLIEMVRNRTMAPDDTSIYTDDEVLDIIDEEMKTQVLDKLLRLHGENLVVTVDVTRTPSGSYTIPYRAIGNKLRDVSLVQGNDVWELSQISTGELPQYSNNTDTYSQLDLFYMEGNKIKLVTPTRAYDSIRIKYYLRPSYITKIDKAGIIDSITKDAVLGTVTYSLSQVGKNFTATDKFDIVGAKTPNVIKAMDLEASTLITGTTGSIIFTIDDIENIDDIAVGDYITLAEESPVPNIPTEMHPMLAQAAAIQILEGLNDTEGLTNAEKKMKKIVDSVQTLIDNRVELAPKKIKPIHGALRSQLGNRKGTY